MPGYSARHAASDAVRYRGEHRAPSTTARALTIGGVSAGALAASVIGPVTAHAATASQWDRVAACESGDHWNDNTGNGYYGGLQFSASTWSGYGGGAYAPLASEATAAEQMAIADKVLAAQGWGAWPVCSRNAGVEDTPTTTPVVKHVAVKASFQAVHVESKTHHSESPALAKSDAHTKNVRAGEYRVHSGDTLSSIARDHHERGGWQHLYEANRHVVGSNPDNIHAGEKLRVQHVRGERAHNVLPAKSRRLG